MIELKSYTLAELREVLHTKDPQGIRRKLNNYGITYTSYGRGDSLIFSITGMESPFKVFCITELGFSANCKFERLRDYILYFFCWEEFREFPDEKMEIFLRENDQYVCRQTIRGWLKKLEQNGLIVQHSYKYIYYGMHNGERCELSKEKYCSAWRDYFQDKTKGASSTEAFGNMVHKYGCIPRKKEVALINGIYTQIIDTMIDLAQQEVEKEMDGKLPEHADLPQYPSLK